MRNKIVLVPFPFDDLSKKKVRPAVCLTDPVSPHDHIVLAFITSKVPVDASAFDIILSDTEHDFSATGLKVSSTIRLHRLITLSRSIFLRELGEISSERADDVRAKIATLFSIR